MLFSGSIPALITPFSDGEIDYNNLAELINWQIEAGSNGLVPVGTTGESPTLTHDEHKEVVRFSVKEAAGRVSIIAGAGSNNTVEAIEFAQHAEQVGADGLLVATPYYNKPTQEGLYQHYKAIAASTELPILIYNIPGRSVIDMTVDTMARLYEISNIVGVKDATAQLDRVSIQRHVLGADFIQLSGEDATALAFNALGGHGCISVTTNIAPELCSKMQSASLKGDFKIALEIQDKLLPLHSALFAEASPGPAKYALYRLGKCKNELRLPLVPITKATEKLIDDALVHAGLLG